MQLVMDESFYDTRTATTLYTRTETLNDRYAGKISIMCTPLGRLFLHEDFWDEKIIPKTKKKIAEWLEGRDVTNDEREVLRAADIPIPLKYRCKECGEYGAGPGQGEAYCLACYITLSKKYGIW